MIKRILLILYLLNNIVYPQSTTESNSNFQTLINFPDVMIDDYFNRNPDKSNGRVNLRNGDVSLRFNVVNGLVSGPVSFDSSSMKFKVDYLNGLKNGKFTISLSEPSKPNMFGIQGTFINNQKNGVFKYYMGGSVMSVETYKNGILNGPSIVYFPYPERDSYPLFSKSERFISIYENGILISGEEYNRNGRIIRREGKSRDKHKKQMKDLQESLENLGNIFSP